jgi:hypothetical protein
MKPLIPGILSGLDALFEDYQYLAPVDGRYPHPPGGYLLTGLPGSLGAGSALFVKPRPGVCYAAQPRMINGAIGSFRCSQSAHWLKKGLLPVFVVDTHHIASPLLAFVPHSEHERFQHGLKV